MKLLMICGTFPPESCGIGDYLFHITRELQKDTDIELSYIVNINWSTFNFFKVLKTIKKINPDIIHIQYPSRGYGASFIPQFISLYFKTFVTIHEVSQAKLLRKLSLFFFSFRSKIIFTNQFEYQFFKKMYPWFHNRYKIIPIGSNIHSYSSIPYNERRREIINFGQIRPQKGLEEVIKLSSLLKENKLDYKVVIMGQLLPEFENYYKTLITNKYYEKDFIEWRLNLSENEISANYSSAYYAYLPFPDGVSERRGSFFAALACETPVFTTVGAHTPENIKNIVNVVNTPEALIYEIEKHTTDYFYNKQNLPLINDILTKHSWESIVNEHKEFYKM